MAEIVFAKERGKERKDNFEINLEEFITIKGISALGNQLTKEKVNQINLLDPLPYEAPEEVHADELEVTDEEDLSKIVTNDIDLNTTDDNESDPGIDGEGQIKLF